MYNNNDDNFNGQGTYYYKNGEKYEGEYKDAKKHGQGTYYYNNGNKYEGGFKNNDMHGKGTFYFKNGEFVFKMRQILQVQNS